MENHQFELTQSVFIKAAPETVFEYFVDPEKLKLWIADEVEIDPTPGGVFNMTVGKTGHKVGEYVEVNRPDSLIFTWGHPSGTDNFPPGSSRVTVTFTRKDGGTQLELHHICLPTETAMTSHNKGWAHFLDNLAALHEGREIEASGNCGN